jgi:hypothetical protein
MSENIPRILSSDSKVYGIVEAEENKALEFPKIDSMPIAAEDASVPSTTAVQSVDQRIRQAMKPSTDDTEVLKPKTFHRLLSETHFALVKEIEQAEKPEVKESLDALRLLLKENADLSNTFQSYANWLQKA